MEPTLPTNDAAAPEASAAYEPREFPFAPAGAGLYLGPATFAPLIGLWMSFELRRIQVSEQWAIAGGLGLALFVGTFWTLVRRWRRPDRVRVGAEELELLRESRRIRHVHLGQLREVIEYETPAGPWLYVADDRQAIALMAHELEKPADYPAFTSRVVERVAAIDPSGTAAREAVAAGRMRKTLGGRPIRATQALSLIIGLASIVLATVTMPPLAGRPFPFEVAGAVSPGLVLAGESWRLLSAPFVHLGTGHLLVTLLGLLGLGALLERLVGWERMLVAFVIGSIAGGAVHVAEGGPAPAVGASPGIFGLVGLLAAVSVAGRRRLPRTLLPDWRFWLIAAAYPLVLPSFGAVSLGAHLAAAASAFLVGLAMVSGDELPSPDGPVPHWRPFAWLSIVALGIGVFASVTHARNRHPDDDEWVVQAYLSLPPTLPNAVLQNDVAYPILVNPGATNGAIEAGARIAEAAVENSRRREPSILDTLAVARYRQGDPQEASDLLEEAISLDPPAPLRSLLERRLQDVRSGKPVDPSLE